ncbi:hypothetical protein H7F37_04270 [Winogradskyella sp. PAMC22761]|nr:hypothetical protein H7F37_04270 [Winogradskyella sp. PAMC22761]
MKELNLNRPFNLMLYPRPLKIYINDVFFDYIEPKEKDKKLSLNIGDTLMVKDHKFISNKIKVDETLNSIQINCLIQNGLFIFAFGSFFLSMVSIMFQFFHPYLNLTMLIPLLIVVYQRTFNRKEFIRLTKLS